MTNSFSPLKAIRIITRWPLVFILPFIVVLTGLVVYVANIKIYRSDSIVLFKSNYIPVEDHFTVLDKVEDQPVQIVRSLLYGDLAQKIVLSVWPELKNNEVEINSKIQSLRGDNGVKLKFQRDNNNALQISYDSIDPIISYQVVRATIVALQDYNRQVTEDRLENAVIYLEKELEVSKNEIEQLEQQIVRVRSGLPLSILELNKKETDILKEILNLMPIDTDFSDEKSLEKLLKFEESVAELNLKLEISKKELEQFESDLQTKKYLEDISNLELLLGSTNNPEISKLSNSILEKEEILSGFKSKGFLEAHPDVILIQNEIDNLKKLKQEKLLSLKENTYSENKELTDLRLESLHKNRIEEKRKEIKAVEDRIVATKAFQEQMKEKGITFDDRLNELSQRKALLLELENKKLVASHSYAQMAKRLGVIKREGRVDQDKFGLSIKVAENPKIPENPIPFAGLPIIIMGISVTIGILFVLASLMSLYETSVFSAIDLFKIVEIPVLGVVDSFTTKSIVIRRRKKIRIIVLLILIYIATLYIYFKFR